MMKPLLRFLAVSALLIWYSIAANSYHGREGEYSVMVMDLLGPR